jgi:hypothetical protein
MKLFSNPETSGKSNRRIDQVEFIANEPLDNGTPDCIILALHMVSPGFLLAPRIFMNANYAYPEHNLIISSCKENEKY